MNQQSEKTQTISDVVSIFIHDLEGVKSAEEIACPLIQTLSQNLNEELKVLIEPIIDSNDDSESISIPFDAVKKFRSLRRKNNLAHSAIRQMPRALHVAMVSTFDAFLGNLLRSIFLMKPELINSSQKELTFSDLVQFDSVSRAREHIIEKEIEAFLRNSHADHFKWLENKFEMPLRKDLDSWPNFIEVTQRRNLFVHSDGIVSQQYLDVCREHGVDIGNVAIGDRLHLNADYFSTSYKCLFEIGVKLAHVVWRKHAPDERKKADEELNCVCYELLQIERYDLAHTLLLFATRTLKTYSSELNRRMFVINLAIASKFGEIKGSENYLKKEDWSDCGIQFKLALAVLNEDFSEACEIMQEIGPKGENVKRVAYDIWPLFKEFRNHEKFHTTYKEIYGDDFKVSSLSSDNEMNCD